MDSIPQNVVDTICWGCKAKGLWKPLPFIDGKPARYKCAKCGNQLEGEKIK